MQKVLFLIIVLFSVLAGCNRAVPVISSPERVVLKQSTDVMPISSFAQSVDYLELKLDKAGLSLGDVEAVKQIDSDWIILHRNSGKSSFIRFNKHGEFVNELAGKSTAEIVGPLDIVAYGKGYAILAENGIHEVSKEGKYTGRLVKGNLPGSHVVASGDQFYVLNDQLAGKVLLETGVALSKSNSMPLPDRLQRMTYTNVQQVLNSNHLFTVLSDSIYQVDGNQADPITTLSGEGTPTFAEIVRKMSVMEELDAIKYLRETEHVIVKKYLENNEFIFLNYWVGSNSTAAVVHKTTGETLYFSHGVNDIDGGIWEKPYFLTDKNELVIPLTAYKVGGHKISNKKVRDFERLQKKIEASGNPVLMLCKLK